MRRMRYGGHGDEQAACTHFLGHQATQSFSHSSSCAISHATGYAAHGSEGMVRGMWEMDSMRGGPDIIHSIQIGMLHGSGVCADGEGM